MPPQLEMPFAQTTGPVTWPEKDQTTEFPATAEIPAESSRDDPRTPLRALDGQVRPVAVKLLIDVDTFGCRHLDARGEIVVNQHGGLGAKQVHDSRRGRSNKAERRPYCGSLSQGGVLAATLSGRIIAGRLSPPSAPVVAESQAGRPRPR